jgi:hypothetical protein
MNKRRSWEKNGGRFPPFVALLWDLLNGPAYKSLPASAAKALPYFLGKVKLPPKDPERYKQSFEFSYREGRKMGFAPATFSKIIQNLVRYGFIDPADKGGLRGDCRSSNKFMLSKRWECFGLETFKLSEWKSFRPALSL